MGWFIIGSTTLSWQTPSQIAAYPIITSIGHVSLFGVPHYQPLLTSVDYAWLTVVDSGYEGLYHGYEWLRMVYHITLGLKTTGLENASSFDQRYLSCPGLRSARQLPGALWGARSRTLRSGIPSASLGVSINGGSPIAGWFVMGNPVKMDDLAVPPF